MPSSSPPHYASVVGMPVGYPSSSVETTQPSNASAYTLDTIAHAGPSTPRSLSPVSLRSNDSDRSPLLNSSPASFAYGATMSLRGGNVSSRKILLNAGVKMAMLFVISTLFLGGTLWLALPTLEEQDRPALRVPKSFAQLQELNFLLKKYRDIYPVRIVICYVTTYLFLQAFSLPGSMYLSILGGAVWGVPIALPLACTCVATGATLCYLISAALGPALLTLPKWSQRLERWSAVLAAQRANLISYLIVLRIAPFPPHWVVNVLAPHLRIGLLPFWTSTFLGILGVSVIHTTIGGGLDDMTSADDFHLISWRNGLGLSAVVAGVLIPVGLRYVLSRRVGAIALTDDDEETGVGGNSVDGGDTVLAQGPPAQLGKGKAPAPQLILLSDSEDEGEDEDVLDEEEDEILEAGPVLVPSKGKGVEGKHEGKGTAVESLTATDNLIDFSAKPTETDNMQ
ncbi:hypothetical protein EW145_g3635 [Phellinidium pouzarii]|uniref:VTT domain-containing protein n=1 Tax=Phellinidium pouzarii TaxID=167371 RepID=A0A4S4L6U8_9AGAM|nr:hypothetical protein EW145_g3635 [Phellinidium pouzarii]